MFLNAKFLAFLAALALTVVNAQGPSDATSSAPETVTSAAGTEAPPSGTESAPVASGTASAPAASGTASAPAASSTAGISPCILACVQPAATKNGCTFTDVACVCASAQFQEDARECLTASCSAADLAAGQALQQQQCGAIGVTPTGSATSGGFTSSVAVGSAVSSALSSRASSRASSTLPASSHSSSSASTSGSSNAAGDKVYFGYGGLVALAVGAFGMAVGGAFVR